MTNVLDLASPGDGPGSSRRGEARQATSWIAMIRLYDGREIPTTIRDVSASGARLTVPADMPLPERFMFKVIGTAFVCAVQLAWRRGDEAGVRIERIAKMTVAGPAAREDAAAISRARRG